MKAFDWTARPDQIDAAMVQHITVSRPLIMLIRPTHLYSKLLPKEPKPKSL